MRARIGVVVFVVSIMAHPGQATAQVEEPVISLRLGGKAQGKLTRQDPRDRILKDSHRKVYEVKLSNSDFQAHYYRIMMSSSQFEPYLRLETPAGKILAEKGRSGDKGDAVIGLVPPVQDVYRIIATSAKPGIGEFTLTIDSQRIIYVPTPEDVVEKMLLITRVTRDDIVYDLG